jgi:predicted Rdx family selenoprotein
MNTILWVRGGDDWDDEQTVTFDADLKVIALHPGAGNHGVFSDIADRMLMDEAQDWLENEGYDEAAKILQQAA